MARHQGPSQRGPTPPLQPLPRTLVLRKPVLRSAWLSCSACQFLLFQKLRSGCPGQDLPPEPRGAGSHPRWAPASPGLSPVFAKLPGPPLSEQLQRPAVGRAHIGSQGCGNEGDPCRHGPPGRGLKGRTEGTQTQSPRALPPLPLTGQVTAAERSALPIVTLTGRPLLNPLHFPRAWRGPRWEVRDPDRQVTNCSVVAFLLENSLYFSQRSSAPK